MNCDHWYICCGDNFNTVIEQYLLSRYPQTTVMRVVDGMTLRRIVMQETSGCAGVVVADGCGDVLPINVAAALVCDQRAACVVLVSEAVTDSYRTRAHHAGISEIISSDQLFCTGYVQKNISSSEHAHHVSSSEKSVQKRGEKDEVAKDEAALEFTRTAEKIADARVPCTADKIVDAGIPRAADKIADAGARRAPEKVADAGARCAPEKIADAGIPRAKEKIADAGAPILTFISGRGGVGKTLVTASMAAFCASWGLNVALIDLDLAFGNLYAFYGLTTMADLTPLAELPGQFSSKSQKSSPCVVSSDDNVYSDELCGERNIDTGLLQHCVRHVTSSIDLWGPCERPEYAEVVAPYIDMLLDYVARTYDIALIDTSTMWGDAVAQAVQRATRVLVVTENQRGDVISSSARVMTLAARLGVERTRIMRVINGCNPHKDLRDPFAETALPVDVGGSIRLDRGKDDISVLCGAGEVARITESRDPFALSVAHGVACLLKELGILPSCPEAQAAYAGKSHKRRLFSFMREAR